MATQRQRRRRTYQQRHQFEYVQVDDEGQEVVVEKPARDERPANGAKPGAGKGKDDVVRDRRGREVPKPSVQRIAKRTAIFAPLLVVLVLLTGRSLTTGQKLFQVVLLLVIFIPFSYLMDTVLYRSFQKRQAKAKAEAAAQKSRR